MNKILMEFEENFWGKSQYYTILIEPLILSLNFNFELVSGKNMLISFISEDDYDKIKQLKWFIWVYFCNSFLAIRII